MGKYYKKYLTLAVIGSIIIGIAFYLLLDNYLDKEEIVVASRSIKAGEKICEEDLELKEYCKSSLPKKFMTDKKDIVGKIINIDRRKDDHISYEMFNKNTENSFMDKLSSGDVVIAVNVRYTEPLLEEVRVGSYISIVSTEYDKDLTNSDYFKEKNFNESKYPNQPSQPNFGNEVVYDRKNFFTGDDYINSTTFNLSENVLLINSQIMVRNLEVLFVEERISDDGSILINNNNKVVSVYVKCNIKEAPFIAKLTKGDDYKIIIEEI